MPQVRANGIDIREHANFGREGDPLILLIMGFAAQLLFWPELLCGGLAAKGFRVVRFDNRDIGKGPRRTSRTSACRTFARCGKRQRRADSGKFPDSLSDMADDAIGVMDALGVERAHIVGASMGGMIAQLVAGPTIRSGEEVPPRSCPQLADQASRLAMLTRLP